MKMSTDDFENVKRLSKECQCPDGTMARNVTSWLWTGFSVILIVMIVYFLYQILFTDFSIVDWWNKLVA